MCQACNFKFDWGKHTEGYLFALNPALAEACVDFAIEHHLGNKSFDAIAFTGMSGAIFAPRLASKMGKELLLVRKPNDDSHSCRIVEASSGKVTSYIVVDDFMSSGNTVDRIVKAVGDKFPMIKLMGIYEYLGDEIPDFATNARWTDHSNAAARLRFHRGDVRDSLMKRLAQVQNS